MSLKNIEARRIYNRDYFKKYYPKNKEKIKKYQQEYYKKIGKTNYELFGKDWYLKNKDRNAKRSKQWAERNRKRMVEIVLKSREKNKEKFDEYQKKFDKSISGKYRYLKNRHKNRQFDGEIISIECFEKLISQPCIYCGDVEGFRGIDRQNNNIGYTKENSVSCCKLCNFMKKDLIKDEFLDHIKKIYEFQKLVN